VDRVPDGFAFQASSCVSEDKAAALPAPKKDLSLAETEAIFEAISNWDRWDNELGATNLITPEKRLAAARLVTRGITVSMARDAIKEAVDSSQPFRHKMTVLGSAKGFASANDEYSVDYHGFTQTHVDALCHIFYNGKMFGGHPYTDVTDAGAKRFDIVALKNGIFTRGVLFDIPRLLGKDYLEASRAIYPEDLDAWEQIAGVKVGSGDAIIVRTGRWARRAAEGAWKPMEGSAGLHASCLPWLRRRDVAVVASDLALDVMPSRVEGLVLPVHAGVITYMGCPILDNLDLEAVSKKAAELGRWEFLLTVAPLAVGGGTGSPINPLAAF
jgi:kynurenine formamidase